MVSFKESFWPYPQRKNSVLQRNVRDKRSSLIFSRVSDEEKKFYNVDTRSDVDNDDEPSPEFDGSFFPTFRP
jgi:hypothetical protein